MTKRNKALILWFKNIGIKDVPIVGGKNAALGEMYRSLMRAGVNIPNGFAVTAHAYRYFLKDSGIGEEIEKMLKGLDTHNIPDLQKRGRAVRNLILESNMPEDLIAEITKAYAKLGKFYRKANLGVAVRSSATAEDLPGASFAGQQETYLNVMGRDEVVRAVRKAIASLTALTTSSLPITLRYVSCCPANEAPGKSSAVAEDLTATPKFAFL